MSYLNNKEKTITLPSGSVVTVRRQTKYELILIGAPPAFFMRNAGIRERANKMKNESERDAMLLTIPETTDSEAVEWMRYMARQNGVLLSRCCLTPIEKDGEKFRIANKEPGETGAGEISWAMIDDADSEKILETINDLDDKTGREAVATFREKPKSEPSTERDRCVGSEVSHEPT